MLSRPILYAHPTHPTLPLTHPLPSPYLSLLIQLIRRHLPITPTLLSDNSRRRRGEAYTGDFEDGCYFIRCAEFVGWFFDHDGGF